MRDSLGNDIKVKKYKTLQCALISTLQTKACRIEGDIETIQMNPNKLLKKDPMGAQSTFENVSARALGDIGALNASQLQKTKTQLMIFPFRYRDGNSLFRISEAGNPGINSDQQEIDYLND